MVFAYMATPVLIMAGGLLLKLFPPKDFNSFFGFRTSVSRVSRETWEYCNSLCAWGIMGIGAIFSILIYALSIFVTDIARLEQLYTFMTIGQVLLLFNLAPVINGACKRKFPDLFKKPPVKEHED